MTKNKNISLIKNMAKTFEPTDKEHKDFAKRMKEHLQKLNK
jgi:hypothetical protein